MSSVNDGTCLKEGFLHNFPNCGDVANIEKQEAIVEIYNDSKIAVIKLGKTISWGYFLVDFHNSSIIVTKTYDKILVGFSPETGCPIIHEDKNHLYHEPIVITVIISDSRILEELHKIE